MTVEETSWLRLHLTPGLGPRRLLRLIAAFSDAGTILAERGAWQRRAGVEEKWAAVVPAAGDPRLRRTVQVLEEIGASLLPYTDPAFPPLLRAIPDPPALLYRRGILPVGEALAVVGSRRASDAGRRLTFEICADLAAREITIVSGLARGIDTTAHLGALEGGGTSVAVLGCGIDQIYPPENAGLFDRLLEHGAIVSEYPPGTPPLAGHFPGRNRIISGLSRGTLIVEAAPGSGSLITAEFALEQGREVFAMPASPLSPVSGGVNQLLKDGAQLVTDATDICSVLWPQSRPRQQRQREEAFAGTLVGNARTLYACLEKTPLHIDSLVRKSGLTPNEVSAILLHLELQGGVEVLPGQRFIRTWRC